MQREFFVKGFLNQQREGARAQGSSGKFKEGGGPYPKEPLEIL
jgi:hypothetical protein